MASHARLTLLMLWAFMSAALCPAAAQQTMIETALNHRPSIVTVYVRTSHYTKPTAHAAFDPASGRFLIAQKAQVAHFDKKGAGVIIRPDGVVVTNYHTIHLAQKIAVTLHDGATFSANVLHVMPEHDLAMLKIDTPYPLRPIPFADSNRVVLGDWVVNIGHSDLLHETITGGVIIGLGTSKAAEQQGLLSVELIQVNMNLYKGDSGGPLLNAKGELIGMISAKARNADRAAFAIPSNKIKILYLDAIK